MGRTQKEINDNIKELENQIDDIRNYRKHRPDIAKMEDELRKLKGDYQDEIQSSITVWRSDIEALKKELKRKKEENSLYISERVDKWFRKYLSGVDWGYKQPRIVWISEDERYVIITNPGGTGGTGTAMGTSGYYYCSSTHWLTEIIEGATYMGSSHRALNSPKWMEFDGRLTKEMKSKMIALTEELRNKKEDVQQ